MLKGPEKERDNIKKIIDELINIADKNGNLTPGDVNTVIALESNSSSDARVNPLHDHSQSDSFILHTFRGEAIHAKTQGQNNIVKSTAKNDIIFAIGPAGTGKTFTSVALAVKALKEQKAHKIVLTRPAVEAGETLGFLPGDLREKVDPYLRPLYDALEEMIDYEQLELHLSRGTIEIAPLAYMRGRTLNNAFVILDEAQNATNIQMKMFLTRIGFNSQAIITGDITQTDLPRKKQSGLISIQPILKNIDGIQFVYLDENDVVRHRLVREIIKAYERHEIKENTE
jgi:phosphate starvation-inducible PhoH-like protein